MLRPAKTIPHRPKLKKPEISPGSPGRIRARVNIADRNGLSALGYATREGHSDIAALLRAAGVR